MGYESIALEKHDILHNKYLIKEILGQGSSGMVYQALNMLDNTYAAIKECMPCGKAFRDKGKKNIKFLDGNIKKKQFELYKNEAEILKEFSELTKGFFKGFLLKIIHSTL